MPTLSARVFIQRDSDDFPLRRKMGRARQSSAGSASLRQAFLRTRARGVVGLGRLAFAFSMAALRSAMARFDGLAPPYHTRPFTGSTLKDILNSSVEISYARCSRYFTVGQI